MLSMQNLPQMNDTIRVESETEKNFVQNLELGYWFHFFHHDNYYIRINKLKRKTGYLKKITQILI